MIRLKEKVILLVIIILATVSAKAQYSQSGSTKKNFIEFLGTTTHVVLDTNEAYNTAIKSAMKETWKVTPYDFISMEEYAKLKKIKKQGHSFIALESTHQVHPQSSHTYYNLACGVGGKMWSYYEFIAFAPIDNEGLEPRSNMCAWRMPMLISSLHKTIMLMQTNLAGEKNDNLCMGLMEEYNKGLSILMNKTLYLTEECFLESLAYRSNSNVNWGAAKKDEVRKYYTYKYQLVSKAEAQAAIEEKRKDVCVLMTVSNPDESIFIYDTERQEVVFVSRYTEYANYIGKRALESINKAITDQLKKK